MRLSGVFLIMKMRNWKNISDRREKLWIGMCFGVCGVWHLPLLSGSAAGHADFGNWGERSGAICERQDE